MLKRIIRMKFANILLVIAVLLVSCAPPPQANAQTIEKEIYVYQDGLASGWEEWLWDGLTVQYDVESPVFAGSNSMALKPSKGWTAWSAVNGTGLGDSHYAYFTFAAQSQATSAWWEVQFLDARGNVYSPSKTFKFQPKRAWQEYKIDLNEHAVGYLPIYGVRFWYITSQPESSTLYVDEMGFGGEAPAPTATPILPAQKISFSVNASRIVQPFSPQMLGVAHGNWDHAWGKQFPGQVPGLDVIYKGAGVGLIRYAGGLWANWVGWERSPQKTPYTEWKPNPSRYASEFQSQINTANTYAFHYGVDEIDSLAKLAQKSGAEVMIQVNLSLNDPFMWADMVRYANVEKGYNFKYWELGNELDLECNNGEASCLDAATYQARAAAYRQAMKAVDPDIVIVGGVPATAHDIVANGWAETPNMSRYLSAGLAAGADALSYHWYSDCNATSEANMATWRWTDDTTAWQNSYSRSWSQIAPTRIENEIIKPSGKSAKLGVTELNFDSCDFSRAPQNGNHTTAIWYADILGRLAYNGVDFVTWYEGFGNGASSGYPSVVVEQDNPSSPDQIYLRPPFSTLFMYGNFFGDRMVQVTGPTPETTSVWASTDSSEPGTLKLIVVNLSPAKTDVTIELSGFSARSGYKYELTSTNPLDRTPESNGPNHTSTINGFKLNATNIATAKTSIPKRSVTVTGNTVTETVAPLSVTAIILQQSSQPPPPTPSPGTIRLVLPLLITKD